MKSSNRNGIQFHHMPSNSRGRPGGSASPTGRMPHDRSRVAVKRSGVTAIVSPSTRSSPDHVPTPAKRDASSRMRSPMPPDVRGLGDRAVLGRVREVEPDAVLVGVAHDADLVVRLDDLDAVRPDRLLQLVVGTATRTRARPIAGRRAAPSRTRR